MKNAHIAILGGVALFVATTQADFALTGNEHLDVTTSHDYGVLYDNSTANMLDGGFVKQAFVTDSATMWVIGNSQCVLDKIFTYNNSTLNIAGGQINELEVQPSSTVNISNGNTNNIKAYQNTTVNITGGQIGNIEAYYNSVINIMGGDISNVRPYSETCYCTIFGYDFRMLPGSSQNLIGGIISGAGNGWLTGKWFDGTSFVIYTGGLNSSSYKIYVSSTTPSQEPKCGDVNHPFPEMDFNRDCRVDMIDFALFAAQWMKCNAPICD